MIEAPIQSTQINTSIIRSSFQATAFTSNRNLPLPEGVEIAVVHTRTRYIARKLFSKKIDGERFLAALLRYATVNPETIRKYSLFPQTGESNDIAVIFVQSVEALSETEGWEWGYITTRKVIKILETLGILFRRRHQNYIEIHLLLGEIDFPLKPILSRLGVLTLDKDPKVAQIARKSIRLIKEENIFPSTSSTPLLVGQLGPVYQMLVQLLQLQGIDTSPANQPLICQATELIAHVFLPEKFARPQGSLVDALGNLLEQPNSKYQTDLRPKGDFMCSKGNSQSLQVSDTKSFANDSHVEEGYLSLLPSPPSPQSPLRQGVEIGQPILSRTEKGNFASSEIPLQGLPSPEKGNFASNVNVDNTNTNKYIDVNVKDQENSLQQKTGYSLAQALDDIENEKNYLSMACKSDPRIILSVFIYVVQQRYLREYKTNPIKNAGKYFTTMWQLWNAYGTYEQACTAYYAATQDVACSGTRTKRIPGIPLDVQSMVDRFWTWSYADIVKEISTQSLPIGGRNQGNSTSSTETVSHWSDNSDQDCLEPMTPSRSGWMESIDQALALWERIEREAKTIPDLVLHFRHSSPRPYHIRGTQKTGYVLDLLIEGVPYICAEPEHWDDYYLAQIKE